MSKELIKGTVEYLQRRINKAEGAVLHLDVAASQEILGVLTEHQEYEQIGTPAEFRKLKEKVKQST